MKRSLKVFRAVANQCHQNGCRITSQLNLPTTEIYRSRFVGKPLFRGECDGPESDDLLNGSSFDAKAYPSPICKLLGINNNQSFPSLDNVISMTSFSNLSLPKHFNDVIRGTIFSA